MKTMPTEHLADDHGLTAMLVSVIVATTLLIHLLFAL